MNSDGAEFWEHAVYRRGLQLNRWPHSDLVAAVRREFAGRTDEPWAALELGCGAGNNLWFLAESGFQTAGIEQSETAAAAARRSLEERGVVADVRVGDCRALPWIDRSFDLVVDRGAITCNRHADVEKILAETARVLRPGGVLLAFTLFGAEHPDLAHGRVVEKGFATAFVDGLFVRGGSIGYFDADDLRRLFGAHFLAQISCLRRTDAGGGLLSEEYTVRAVLHD